MDDTHEGGGTTLDGSVSTRDQRMGDAYTYAADPSPKLQTKNGQSISHED